MTTRPPGDPLRIGLLLVGHIDRTSEHIDGDYPELFDAILAPYNIQIVPFDLAAGRFPDSTDECHGWVCSPSRLSTYDGAPWIPDAEELLRRLIAEEKAYVGICFGHQLAAQALGGTVQRAPGGWEVGAKTYEITARPWWMTPAAINSRISLIASHEDQVIEAPSGVKVFARSENCPNGGMLLGERAWTLQAHPEFTPALADHLLAGRVELVGADAVKAGRSSLSRRLDQGLVAKWMAAFFRGKRN